MKNLIPSGLVSRLNVLFFVFLFPLLSEAQVQIMGVVRDAATGIPITGASVMVKGGKVGTVTDIDGHFNMKDVSSNEHLIVSYLGMQTQEVAVKSGNMIIRLVDDQKSLDEVVVTALGKTVSADKMGSTASVISTEAMRNSGNPTLINQLEGKASGVRVTSPNGDVGGGSNIIIRGPNTFIGESQPLIILDGVPISNEYYEGDDGENVTQQSRLNDINPNDIESMQVLKGASASALWGSRAANGVIVITTKNGQRGSKPNITYSYSKSFDWISSKEPIQSTWGQGTGGVWNKNTNLSWGDKIADRSGGADVLDKSGAYFLAQSGTVYYPILQKNSRETYVDSNYDAVFQTGGYDQHDLSISGGGDRATYFLSYGGLFQDGIYRNTGYDKHNLRLNSSYRFTDWLKINTKVSYTHSRTNRAITNGDTTDGAYLSLLRNPADFDIHDYIGTYVSASGQEYINRQRMYRNEIGASQQPTYNNPLWSLYRQRSLSKVNRFIFSPEILVTPLSWLDVTLRGGIDYFTDNRDTYFPIGSSYSTYSSGYYNYLTETSRELNFDAIVRATHKFSKDFTLRGTLGFSINDRDAVYNNDRLTSFDVNTDIISSSLSSNASASNWVKTVNHIRSNRGYAIVDLDLFNQLYVSATGMDEAASTVAGNYFYPSVDAAWQFSHLLQPNSFLSFGKLRASWGQVGTEPEPYKSQTLATTANSSFGGSYAVSSERGNTNLKPEVKTEWEVGADLRFFHDNLEMKMTYYSNIIRNLLFDVELNPSSGYSTYYDNAGKMRNRGFEFEAKYHIIQNKDFNWDTSLNFNKNDNMVLSLGGTGIVSIGGSSVAMEGYPLGVLYRPGSLRDSKGNLILDANGFPQLSSGNVVLGNPNPDWRGSFGMDFKWKSFDFSFLFEHSQGGVFLNRTMITLYGFGVHKDVSHEVTLTEDIKNYKGVVYKSGTTVRGNVYNFGGGDVLLDESWYNGLGGGLGVNKVNDLYVQDNTWTKLRNVTIGYTWNNGWLRRSTFISSIRFSVTGRDLLVWSHLTGVDPESNNYGVSNAQGMDYFSSPATRSVIFNAQFNF